MRDLWPVFALFTFGLILVLVGTACIGGIVPFGGVCLGIGLLILAFDFVYKFWL